jgi:hypothetical protein
MANGWARVKSTALWMILFEDMTAGSSAGSDATTTTDGGGYMSTPPQRIWQWVGIGGFTLGGRGRRRARRGVRGLLAAVRTAGTARVSKVSHLVARAQLAGTVLGAAAVHAVPKVVHRLVQAAGYDTALHTAGHGRACPAPVVAQRMATARGQVVAAVVGAAGWTVDMPDEDALLLLVP